MTTLTKDSSTGSFVGSGRDFVDLTGGTATPAVNPNDPYTVFNQNLAKLLISIRDSQNQGRTNLAGAKDTLTNESVAPAGPVAFNPTIGSGSQVSGQEAMETAFQPAITSINTQLQNADAATNNLGQDIGTLETAYQPQALSSGQTLVTKDGQVLERTPNFQPPQIRPDTGQLDSFDAANGVWKSDIVSGAAGSSGGSGGSSGNGVVAGIDLSKYNPSDPQYADKVKSIYQTLSTSNPNPTADTLDAYIVGHGGKAPVSGQMIMQVSSQYGIDPNLLASQLALESDFGNAGEAPKNFNPGGVVYAGQPGATQGSPRPASEGGYYAKFSSWMQGLNAMAGVLSKDTPSAAPKAPSGSTSIAPSVEQDAQALASGALAPQVLSDRYTNAYGSNGGALYNIAIQEAKKINPLFSETEANLKYKGEQTQTDNLNSGNPITSIWSFLKKDMTPSILNPSKPAGGTTSTGVGYTILP